MNEHNNKTFQIIIFVTHECNLNCIYCYEQNKAHISIRKEKAQEIISQYLNSKDYDYIIIEFFGGEPWLNSKLIIDICEWTWNHKWKNNYRFFTSTNGTLIHGEIQEWLNKHNKQISCGLSLDGTPMVHNHNRSNSFEKIDISFFITNWPNQPIKMTISNDSIDCLAESIIYIHKLGFKLSGTNFAECIDWSNERFIKILSRELGKLVEFYTANPQVQVAPIIDLPIEICEYEKKHIPNKFCAARNMAAYDVDGKEYPCNFFTPMTFSKEQLDNIHHLDFLIDSNLIDEECFSTCYLYPICPNCYGANYLKTGKLSERDKTKCNLIKVQSYFTAALKAQKLLKKHNIQGIDKSNTIQLIDSITKIKSLFETHKWVQNIPL